MKTNVFDKALEALAGEEKPTPFIFRKRFTYALTRRPSTPTTVPKGFVDLGPATTAHPHGTATYAKPLTKDAIESFELEPLDPDDPRVLKRARQAYRDKVYKRFSDTNGFDQVDDRGGHTTLSFSTRSGVEYQVTFWTPDWEPTGHLDLNDFDEAVGALFGKIPPTERRKLQSDAVWRHRRP